MSNRKNYKLLERIVGELTHEQVEKVLTIFKVNDGNLILTDDNIMLEHDTVITNYNRIDRVSLKDFSINAAEVKKPLPPVEKKTEDIE